VVAARVIPRVDGRACAIGAGQGTSVANADDNLGGSLRLRRAGRCISGHHAGGDYSNGENKRKKLVHLLAPLWPKPARTGFKYSATHSGTRRP
jgi:hypothetical protein